MGFGWDLGIVVSKRYGRDMAMVLGNLTLGNPLKQAEAI